MSQDYSDELEASMQAFVDSLESPSDNRQPGIAIDLSALVTFDSGVVTAPAWTLWAWDPTLNPDLLHVNQSSKKAPATDSMSSWSAGIFDSVQRVVREGVPWNPPPGSLGSRLVELGICMLQHLRQVLQYQTADLQTYGSTPRGNPKTAVCGRFSHRPAWLDPALLEIEYPVSTGRFICGNCRQRSKFDVDQREHFIKCVGDHGNARSICWDDDKSCNAQNVLSSRLKQACFRRS